MTNDKNALLGAEMTYSNTAGRKRFLYQMVREEPDWAASRIRVCEQLEGVEIPELHSRIFKLESEVESLRRHLLIEREAQAKKLDAINAAFNRLREAVFA